jgi:hypothetical protein
MYDTSTFIILASPSCMLTIFKGRENRKAYVQLGESGALRRGAEQDNKPLHEHILCGAERSNGMEQRQETCGIPRLKILW